MRFNMKTPSLLLAVMPGAPSSVLAPSSEALAGMVRWHEMAQIGEDESFDLTLTGTNIV